MQKYKLSQIILIPLFVFISQTYCKDIKDNTVLNPALIGPQTIEVNQNIYHRIYYVSQKNGSDQKNDGSKIKPWQSINFALSKAKDTSSKVKYAILVAEGIYSTSTIKMVEYVDLFGGYFSKNWDRDIYKYTSVLDGKSVRRVVEAASNASLDGFTIQNGLSRSHGGGILCEDTSPTISNNLIVNNFVLEPKTFNHNRIHQEGHIGGGVACLYNAVPIIKNNIFYGNRTSIGTGGAIAFYGWFRHKDAPSLGVDNNRLSGGLRARVENNVIVNNIAGINDFFRTRSSSGGGIACAYESRPVIKNNLVALNQAMGNSDAGGIYCEYYSDPDIIGNWIVGNIGDDDGGGFYTMRLGQPLLKGNIIAGNFTTGKGVGGIRISKEGRARITDNIIVQNPGGGVMCVDSYVELIHNIIASNPLGAGLVYRTNFTYFKPSVVKQNIIINNEKEALSLPEKAIQTIQLSDNTIENDYMGNGNNLLKEMELKEALKIKIKSAHFDSEKYKTHLILESRLNENLTGRVIHLNHRWSIVQEQMNNQIIIWGNVLTENNAGQELYVLPVYKN